MHIGILEDDAALASHVLKVIESQNHTGAIFPTAKAFFAAAKGIPLTCLCSTGGCPTKTA